MTDDDRKNSKNQGKSEQNRMERSSKKLSKTLKEIMVDTSLLEAITTDVTIAQDKRFLASQFQEMRKQSKALNIPTDVIDQMAGNELNQEMVKAKRKYVEQEDGGTFQAIKPGDDFFDSVHAKKKPAPPAVTDPKALKKSQSKIKKSGAHAGPAVGQKAFNANDMPLAGCEDTLMSSCTRKNALAWHEAAGAFPEQLREVPVKLLKAFVRNELAHYRRENSVRDMAASTGQILPNNPPLGMSQVTASEIRAFEVRYPQFHTYIYARGYKGTGHEQKALLDAECIPMIMAAKIATLVDEIRKSGIKHPTYTQLAYAYNPDVYSYSAGENDRVYKSFQTQMEATASKALHFDQRKEKFATDPRIAMNSKHVQNILKWMK